MSSKITEAVKTATFKTSDGLKVTASYTAEVITSQDGCREGKEAVSVLSHLELHSFLVIENPTGDDSYENEFYIHDELFKHVDDNQLY